MLIRRLALDISSTCTGWALLEGPPDGAVLNLVSYGSIEGNGTKNEHPYPWSYVEAAGRMAQQLVDLVCKCRAEGGVDEIVVEETNKARQRFSQKILEFIHCTFLNKAQAGALPPVVYISTSDWRRACGVALTKEDRANNVKLRRGKSRGVPKSEIGISGKFDLKKAAIRWVNGAYGLALRPKDEDIAEAIALGVARWRGAALSTGKNTKKGA